MNVEFLATMLNATRSALWSPLEAPPLRVTASHRRIRPRSPLPFSLADPYGKG